MTQTLYRGVDAAYPGAGLPAGTSILAAYIGGPNPGAPDTPHIWTGAEWNSYITQNPGLHLLPIYVHNYPDGNPVADADNACDAAERLGWAPGMPGASRRIIVFDVETLVAWSYVQAVSEQISDRGFRCVPYGSAGYVVQNPSCYGYWEALLTTRPPTALNPMQRGIQYAFGTDWDRDVFDQLTYDGCGIGPRHE